MSKEPLSDVLSEFARTMVTDFPIQSILDHLVKRIVDVLPVTAAGVMLISSDTDPRYVAASDASALRFEELQIELGEGPCLVAYQTGEAVAVADLRNETRFPKFRARALEAGLVAVFTVPLRSADEELGALDLYQYTAGSLDADTMESAQTLADVAAAYLLNAQARADLRASSARSRQRALHDPLTGLPNRILLLERLDHAVLRSCRSGTTTAVLFAGLDRFKLINDLYGHRIGDELLVAVAQRLSAVMRSGDTLARMSGDEFVILCEDLEGPEQVDVTADRIGAALATPFVLSGARSTGTTSSARDAEVEMTASIGIACSGRDDQPSERLLHDADTAMYQAKRKGGARHQFIDVREQNLAAQRNNLEHELRGAPARGELQTAYQPIVDTGDGRITGVEALLRWAHPTRGSVMPTLLVPLAEESGLITEIGRWVLEQACRDRHRWQNDRSPNDLKMSVNVSAHQLMSPDYVATVAAVLSDTDTDPKQVTLEVTESVFVQDSERALVVLRELKYLGVKLALDDFGTGYSSLNYLKRFPIDIVKIDQEFVADLEQDRASHAIVRAVVELAHTLDITVVAEGVETAEQHQHLASVGCDSCQGNYFARPMSANNLDALTQQQRTGGTVHLPTPTTAANLTGTDLIGADLAGADLARANLTGADLSFANLAGADLTRADLTDADLTRADLTGADLAGTNLARANLARADLHTADLIGANLTGANLSFTNLTLANLTLANLTQSDFAGAELTQVDLTHANLVGTNFAGAQLDSDFDRDSAIYDETTVWPWTTQGGPGDPEHRAEEDGCLLPARATDTHDNARNRIPEPGIVNRRPPNRAKRPTATARAYAIAQNGHRSRGARRPAQ